MGRCQAEGRERTKGLVGWKKRQIIRLLTHLHIARGARKKKKRDKGKKEIEQKLNMVKPIIHTYTRYRTKQPLHYH